MTLIDLATLEDYRVAADDPDPRGWAVVACDNVVVGTVTTLLIDVDQSKVRYLICDLSSHRIALPTAFARLDRDRHRVLYDTADSALMASLPAFAGALTPAEAEQIDCAVLGEKIELPAPGESVDRRASDRRAPDE